MAKASRKKATSVPGHREENTVVLDWPEGYVASFAGVPDDLERPAQGSVEKRRELRNKLRA